MATAGSFLQEDGAGCPTKTVGPITDCAAVAVAVGTRPCGTQANRAIFEATVGVLASWASEDRALYAKANGLLSDADHLVAAQAARLSRDKSLATLERLLPAAAHTSVQAGLATLAPRVKDPVGETLRRWKDLPHRHAAANDLLVKAHHAQQRVDRAQEEDRRRLAEAEAKVRRAAEFRQIAFEALEQDFLAGDAWFSRWDTNGEVEAATFQTWKAEFVQAWASEHLDDPPLDLDQARAIATLDRDLRLVARAGSGKTRTLVTRALFLVKHCKVRHDEVLLIAFNRKAVHEIKERLTRALQGAPLPHVATFHALAYALLRPTEELVFDDEDAETHNQSSKVQSVVDDFLHSRMSDVRRAMLTFFSGDWDSIAKRGLHLTKAEFFEVHASATKVTLGGEWVKSYGEQLIANTLFRKDVNYSYERNHTRGGFNYRPDFTVLAGRKIPAVIEYFGLVGDPTYDAEMQKKRAYWDEQRDTHLIEVTPQQISDLGPEGLSDFLMQELTRAGVACTELSEDEVWERAKKRAVDTFSKALKTFVARSRQLNLSPDDLQSRIDGVGDSGNAAPFLALAVDVYAEYLRRAVEEHYDDFSGVVWRAAAAVAEGSTSWTREKGQQVGDLRRIKFLHVDEFQDFSAMFMEFVRSIRRQCPQAVLCAVGDDWQAINGFAGADLDFFDRFDRHFDHGTTQYISTNYRSPVSVVDAGNRVMEGFGTPAKTRRQDSGTVQIASLAGFVPTLAEDEQLVGDLGTAALLRLITHCLDVTGTEGKIAVLFRRNGVPWFTGRGNTYGSRLESYASKLLKFLPSEAAEQLELTTAHKFKGREADAVIVADADENSYPLIHPTAELFTVFGDTVDSIREADRRLFYVATTRAEHTLIYFVPRSDGSEFLANVETSGPSLNPNEVPSTVRGSGTELLIRVYDGHDVKEGLKDPFRFQFEETTRTWIVRRPAESFDFSHVRQVLAFIGTRLIEVCDETGTVIHHAGFRLRP